MNTDFLKLAFEGVADSVLWLAGLIKEPFVPGLVVSFLLLALVVFIVCFWQWSRDRLKAISRVNDIIVGLPNQTGELDSEDLRAEFYGRQPEVTSELTKLGRSKGFSAQRLAFAWREYRETLKVDSDAKMLLNGIRPSIFFNTEDLDTEARGWRVLPGLFVSTGLAFTFLGLIAALQQTGEALIIPQQVNELLPLAPGGPKEALQKLLVIASAKFIMSLTGLVCSIVFTIVLRRRLGKLERAIDHLCIDIEKRVGFIALESLAFDQKKLMEEQKAHSQKFDAQLIASLGHSLKEDLPNAISASINQSMEPMLKQVGQVGSEGMQEMVGDLASQFSGDVARAMGDAAERFDGAAARIETLADALRGSAGEVNGSMEKSLAELTLSSREMRDVLTSGASATRKAFESGSADVLERMNGSLSAIQASMEAANSEQRAAADSISLAAHAFAERVDVAGRDASVQVSSQLNGLGASVSLQLTDALQPLLVQARSLADEASDQVVRPVRELASALDGFVSRLEHGTNRMEGLSGALEKGTDAASRSADVLGEASGSLKAAAEPIATLARGLNASANATAEAATGIAGSLNGQREIVQTSLNALSISLTQFQGVIERYDSIDEKLGDAFSKFRSEVDASIQRIGEHSDGVHETYADALSQLQSVVDQAAEFRPISRR